LPSSFDGPGTLVVVTVTDYRYVSTGARYGLGVMTGNARAEAEATFHVLPEQRLAGTREYSTSSTAWQGIFSAMTPKQLAAIAAQMIATSTRGTDRRRPHALRSGFRIPLVDTPMRILAFAALTAVAAFAHAGGPASYGAPFSEGPAMPV